MAVCNARFLLLCDFVETRAFTSRDCKQREISVNAVLGANNPARMAKQKLHTPTRHCTPRDFCVSDDSETGMFGVFTNMHIYPLCAAWGYDSPSGAALRRKRPPRTVQHRQADALQLNMSD